LVRYNYSRIYVGVIFYRTNTMSTEYGQEWRRNRQLRRIAHDARMSAASNEARSDKTYKLPKVRKTKLIGDVFRMMHFSGNPYLRLRVQRF
jgi:hypothetical protein